MYDRKWLEQEIVRLAEKFPDRTAPFIGIGWGNCGPQGHCIVGQIAHDHGLCRTNPGSLQLDSIETYRLQQNAMAANDEGMQWGLIPAKLGLLRPAVDTEANRVKVEAMKADRIIETLLASASLPTPKPAPPAPIAVIPEQEPELCEV